MAKIDWYDEFVKKSYKPKSSDTVVLYRYTPRKGLTTREAIGRMASESSAGTWTTLARMPKMAEKLRAYTFSWTRKWAKIAYPRELFEPGSMPCFLSGPAGNIFGMKAIDALRFQDVSFSSDFLKNFKGPVFGQDAIKKIFRRKSGPITSVVPKPKLGFSSVEHAGYVGYSVWKGGIDCVKDDENLTDQKFNRFATRVKAIAKYRDKAERETGEVKDAFINCTAPTLKELERRVKLVHDHGFRYFMLDLVISGFTAVGTASELAHDHKMAIHGHRAMHAMFTRDESHGMSMLALAKLYRTLGVDQVHTGTVVGKLGGDKAEIMAMKDMLLKNKVDELPGLRLSQNWGKIKPTLPVSSGGLHPGILPAVFDIYGTTDIAIQVGGGTLGHPHGAEAGARAVMQSIEAYKQGTSLNEYAKDHKELAAALEKWGTMRPV